MNKKYSTLSHSIPSIFLFILIGLFAVSALTLTLIGTRVYRSVTDNAAGNIDSQMVLSYLCNKVRAFDHEGGVEISTREGMSVLRLYEEIEGKPYETDIYVYQGMIREAFMPRNEAFFPEYGEMLAAVSSLTFQFITQNLLETTVAMPNGDTGTLRIAMRTGLV
jgi:hypothetical protein